MSTNVSTPSAPSAPTTPAGVEPVIASSTGVTFDDLEAVTATPKKEAKKEPKKETKAPKEEKESSDTPDAEKESEEVESAPSEKEETSDKEKPKTEKKDEPKAPKVKTYKVKVGETEVEVPSTTEFEVTVNGKPEKVPVAELLTNYAGKTDWTRKYTDLDKERKSFHSERDSLTGSINKLYDLAVKQNDPGAAIGHLVEAMGGNALDVMKQLRSSFWEQFERHKDLSPEQREALDTKEQLSFLQKRDQDRAAAEKARAIEAQVGERVKAVQEAHNLTDAGFYQAYEALKNSGHVDPQSITPELVGKYIVTKKEFDGLGQMIKEANPEAEVNDKDVEELLRLMRSNQFQLEDMRDVIKQVYGQAKQGGRLAKKLKGGSGKSTAVAPSNPKSEPFSWDEI